MNLATATKYADQILTWLNPHSTRLAIAGSIRRQRPECADIDIVCIPKVDIHHDLLGAVASRDNYCLQYLQDYVRERNPTASPARAPRFVSGGEKEGKQVILQLPKCQLDLWFADESTWSTILMCRTGSKEHNIWLCDRAIDLGLHWNPYEGLANVQAAEPVETPTEESIYQALGLAYIDPINREQPWITKNLNFGL